MVVVITEFANEFNFTLDKCGEQISQWEFDNDDTCGILGTLLTLISEHEDVTITWHMDY